MNPQTREIVRNPGCFTRKGKNTNAAAQQGTIAEVCSKWEKGKKGEEREYKEF